MSELPALRFAADQVTMPLLVSCKLTCEHKPGCEDEQDTQLAATGSPK